MCLFAMAERDGKGNAGEEGPDRRGGGVDRERAPGFARVSSAPGTANTQGEHAAKVAAREFENAGIRHREKEKVGACLRGVCRHLRICAGMMCMLQLGNMQAHLTYARSLFCAGILARRKRRRTDTSPRERAAATSANVWCAWAGARTLPRPTTAAKSSNGDQVRSARVR